MNYTNRERYRRLFCGEPVDRVPFIDIMGFWKSSLDRWKNEGLDKDATKDTVVEMMGFDGRRGVKLPVRFFVWPEYEKKIVRRESNKIFVRNGWGKRR